MEYNNDFKYDLLLGQIREKQIAKILKNKSIEIKSEENNGWVKSGNIAIEINSRGKPSGLSTTQADYWWHCLQINDEDVAHIVFPVDKLRKLVEKMFHNETAKVVKGGDNNTSDLVLLPLSTLFKNLK